MKMTYVSPSGQKVQASDDKNTAPVVDVSNNSVKTPPQSTANSNSIASPNTGFFYGSSKINLEYDLSRADEFRKFIEVETLKIIKKLAEEGKATKERIQEIARRTLELIKPGMSLEELYRNAVKLDDNFSELAPVVYVVMKFYEEKYEKKALEEVTRLVRQRQFDQAGEMVKKVLQFKIGDG